MKAWLAAFDAFEAMRPTTIVPSHGAVGEGSIIAANRAIMRDIQARVRELKAQGQSADEAATTVQSRVSGQASRLASRQRPRRDRALGVR